MNYFGLDEFTYNMLINYFISVPEIKIIRIFGSRATDLYRKSSDIDLFIECTCSDEKIFQFKKEINSLKHPYRIEFTNVNSEKQYVKNILKRRFNKSKLFYDRKDFDSNETYIAIPIDSFGFDEDNFPNWVRRYLDSFLDVKDWFFNLFTDDIAIQQETNFEINLFMRFKKLFKYCRKTIKYYLEETYNVNKNLSQDIFFEAEKYGIIKNNTIWNNMIIDFNIMTDEDFVTVRDELLYRLKKIYIPEIENLSKFFEKKYLEQKAK